MWIALLFNANIMIVGVYEDYQECVHAASKYTIPGTCVSSSEVDIKLKKSNDGLSRGVSATGGR
jgi:hypothetical protein